MDAARRLVSVHARVPSELADRLAAAALDADVSASTIVRHALRAHLAPPAVTHTVEPRRPAATSPVSDSFSTFERPDQLREAS